MLTLFAILLLVWFIISGYVTALPLVPGVLSIFIIVVMFYNAKACTLKKNKSHLNVWRLIKYIPYLIKEIFISNLLVAFDILSNKVQPEIIEVDNPFKSRGASILFANSVILTPGSIVVDYSHELFLIHVLDHKIEQSVLAGEMINRIKNIEDVSDIDISVDEPC